MRRRLIGLVGCVAMAGPATPALGSHEGRSGDGRDFVAGAARNMLLDVSPYPVALQLAAHGSDAELPLGGPFGGSDVTGHAVGSGEFPARGEFRVAGEVTCLKVVGNRATVKYRFNRTSGPGAPPPGWGVQVFLEDNGPPSGGVPDGNATDAPLPPQAFEPTADQCELPRGPFNPVDAGNYVVRDADSLPLP